MPDNDVNDAQQATPETPAVELAAGRETGRGTRLLTAAVAGAETHRDTLNTNTSASRRKFCRELAVKLGLPEDALLHLDGEITTAADEADVVPEEEELAEQEPDRRSESQRILDDTPAETLEAAQAFLENPNMVDELRNDVGNLGLVGELVLAIQLFLVATSRILAKPLGASVRSASSTGKTYTTNIIVDLMPPESVIKTTAITAQALYYLPPGSLEHKLVVVAERKHANGRDDADARNETLALREMLSSGELVKLVPVKSEGGMITQRIHQEGPIAYIETTTADEIVDEDSSRLLALRTDESRCQTRRIMRQQAEQAAGRAVDELEQNRIKDKHRAAQRLLRPLSVRVPFAELLSIADHCVVARRAFQHLIEMVRVVALLRQHQKTPSPDGWISADADDYEIAYQVMLPVLRRALAPVSEQAIELRERLRETYGSRPFTVRNVVELTGISRTAARNRIKLLEDAGLASVHDAQRGQAHHFVLRGPGEAATDLGLITPDELREAIERRPRPVKKKSVIQDRNGRPRRKKKKRAALEGNGRRPAKKKRPSQIAT